MLGDQGVMGVDAPLEGLVAGRLGQDGHAVAQAVGVGDELGLGGPDRLLRASRSSAAICCPCRSG